jgi:hypothetical protein
MTQPAAFMHPTPPRHDSNPGTQNPGRLKGVVERAQR